MSGDPPGYMGNDRKELVSPLPSRRKYSSPSRSRMGPECCCCCWEFWVWGAGTRRAPPRLSKARHSESGKKATSRITVVPSKLSFMSGYQQESGKKIKSVGYFYISTVPRNQEFTHIKQASHECNSVVTINESALCDTLQSPVVI